MTPEASKESGVAVGPRLNHPYGLGFGTNESIWNSRLQSFLIFFLYLFFFPFSPYVQCRATKQMSWFKHCHVAGFGSLVLKSLKHTGPRGCSGCVLCWEVARLLLPVIPFSVHLDPVKSQSQIKFKKDSPAVSFPLESAQLIAPCTCNDCKCLSQTVNK